MNPGNTDDSNDHYYRDKTMLVSNVLIEA